MLMWVMNLGFAAGAAGGGGGYVPYPRPRGLRGGMTLYTGGTL